MQRSFMILLATGLSLAPLSAQAGDGNIGFWRWVGLGWGPGYHAGEAAPGQSHRHGHLHGAPGVPYGPLMGPVGQFEPQEIETEAAPAAAPAPAIPVLRPQAPAGAVPAPPEPLEIEDPASARRSGTPSSVLAPSRSAHRPGLNQASPVVKPGRPSAPFGKGSYGRGTF